MAVATLLWLYILHRLPTTISSLSSLLVPIVGVVAAWIQLGERPSVAEGIGMVLILVALAVLILPQRSAADHAAISRPRFPFASRSRSIVMDGLGRSPRRFVPIARHRPAIAGRS